MCTWFSETLLVVMFLLSDNISASEVQVLVLPQHLNQGTAQNVERKKKSPIVPLWQEHLTNIITVTHSSNRLGQGQHPGSTVVCVTAWQQPWKAERTTDNGEILPFLQALKIELICRKKNYQTKKPFSHALIFSLCLLILPQWQQTCRCRQPQRHQCKDWTTAFCWIDFTVLSDFPCIEMEFPGCEAIQSPWFTADWISLKFWRRFEDTNKQLSSWRVTCFVATLLSALSNAVGVDVFDGFFSGHQKTHFLLLLLLPFGCRQVPKSYCYNCS